MLVEQVIHKVFNHYSIPIEYISNSTRKVFQSKLYRMGNVMCHLGGPKRKKQMSNWEHGRLSTWLFQIPMKDANMHLQTLLVRAQAESAHLRTELEKVRVPLHHESCSVRYLHV